MVPIVSVVPASGGSRFNRSKVQRSDSGQRVVPIVNRIAIGSTVDRQEIRWSESIVVGSLAFIDKVNSELGFRAAHRDVVEADGTYALREPAEAYALGFAAENEALRAENTLFWDETIDEATI
jgi:hypothetical protein